ncbi:MAG: hypothetical protein R3C02_04800 [Planctomycetaceae bacterium]
MADRFRPHRLMHAAVLSRGGRTMHAHCRGEEPEHAAADRVVAFEAQWHCTLRQEQLAVATKLLVDAVGRQPGRLGIEHAAPSPHVLSAFGINSTADDRLVDLDPTLWQLRRRKDPYELAMIRRAIDCTEAMCPGEEIITPGITELQVFSELHAAAVDVAGEPLVAARQ